MFRIITERLSHCYLWFNTAAMSPSSQKLLVVLLAISALAAGALSALWQRSDSAPAEVATATLYQAPRPLPDLAGLVDHRGEPLSRERFEGQWTWLFFGFTHCPDVCPITLDLLARAQRQLAGDEPPQIALVTVDPERDDPEAMSRYVTHFGTDTLGITGGKDALESLAAAMYVSFGRVPLENGGYTMDHSAGIFFVNPRAEVIAVTTPPHTADHVANDFIAIRSRDAG